MIDKEIIYECQHGNKQLFDKLINDYHDKFFKFCFFLTKNQSDANDLYQQTWLKVYENINSFDIQLNFRNWLYTIAANTFKDSLRKQKRIKNYDFDIQDKKINSDLKLDLENNIINLEEQFRIPVVLFYYEGFKIEEIAKLLSVNIGTVKYRLKIAKEKLFQKMGDEYNG